MSNNGKPVTVRMQTKDELIDALRDQCKFWRKLWSESVDSNLALEKRVDESIKQLKEIKDHIEKNDEIR
tara:strand:+ start:2537 stop:2743 length:207 start_codon:yes stop_codon:yes gene_type:complete